MKSVKFVSNFKPSNDSAQPNWLFRGLIIFSLLVHVVLFMHLAKIYRPRTMSYLELSMRSKAEPAAREIPRPPVRPTIKKQTEKVPLENTRLLPVDPPPETGRPVSIPDISRESVALPRPPDVEDLNVSEWTPAVPARVPAAPVTNVQPEMTEEDYRDIVDRKIRNSVKYPARAKKRSLEGRVTIAVTIGADGGIEGMEITRSSGHTVLDRAVLKAVKDSAPFSRPPDGPVTVIVPIQFRLI